MQKNSHDNEYYHSLAAFQKHRGVERPVQKEAVL